MSHKENDIAWREFDIHQPDDEDDEEDRNFAFQLFAPKEQPYEIMEFLYPELSHKISIRGKADEGNSTGLGLWLGSEVLCKYMLEHHELIHGKRVLELGAGLGLCGIVAHHLGAAEVFMTDGDKEVLINLRYNMNKNLVGTDTYTNFESKKPIISCPQLIWGKNLDAFEKQHGRFSVLISSDCVYLTQSLERLWKTVRALLQEDGIYLYVNSCSSQTAARNGFEWTATNPDNLIDSVFMFRIMQEV